MNPTTEENAVFPPLPKMPAGARLSWLGEYCWSETPRQEAWAQDANGTLWVSVYEEVTERWGAWELNESEAVAA